MPALLQVFDMGVHAAQAGASCQHHSLCDLQIIHSLDIGITGVFGVEALLKIIAFNFLAYIRVNSNKVGTFHLLQSRCFYRYLACNYTISDR